jgi:hypothetical protein
MRRYFGSIDVSLKCVTIDWRSWRLLAQHVNREVFKQPRYTNLTTLVIDGIEVRHDKPIDAEIQQWSYNHLEYDDSAKKASATSISTEHKQKPAS